MKTIRVMVDKRSYDITYGIPPTDTSRRYDYEHDYEEMDLTPEQIKDCIEKCIDIKTLQS